MIDIDQESVCALEVLEESDSNRSHPLSNSASLSVRERFGDNLKGVVVNHVSDPRLGEHHDRMSVSLQDAALYVEVIALA